jgi:ABC-2 type transport system permease protein
LFAGVNFSIVLFPWPVQEFAQLLPMTHGIEAARRAIDGAPVIDLLVREAVTGLVLLVLASLLLLWLERLARRHATVELS